MQNDFRPVRSAKPVPKLKSTSPKKIVEPTVPFETPDQVSQHDSAAASIPVGTDRPQGTGHHWFNLPWPPNREEIWLLSIVLVMAVFGVFGFVKLHKQPVAIQPVVAVRPAKKAALVQPTTVASTLSGLPVAPDVNQRPVVGVMIENSLDARPQAGLSQAGVVFEAVAEGGVTRFLALFQDQQPTNVGPVRSARPYYAQWDDGFDAAYAHVGGSPDALSDIKTWNIKDLNQFYNASVYHRVSTRVSPHNVYSSVVDLANLATKKGYTSNFSGFGRKTASPSTAPSVTSIDMNLSSSIYNPHFAYDTATNTYVRSEGGAAQIDSNTGKQLAPTTVISMVVPESQGALDASGAYYSNYNPIGSGTADIFQDGTLTTGTWSKPANNAPLSFVDANGQTIKLDPGQTWITAITAASKVSYK